jgi:uncharacterized paraquat-inducible protein A
MRHDVVRCSDCNETVQVPSVRTQRATCASCVARKRAAINRALSRSTTYYSPTYWMRQKADEDDENDDEHKGGD